MIRRATYMFACRKVLTSIQAELDAGTLEKPSTSRVRCDRRIVQEFHVNEPDFLEIRDAAMKPMVKWMLRNKAYSRKRNPYLSRIGRLMGINMQEFREVQAEDDLDDEEIQLDVV
uniref:Uncharacterized protein n=1 Tax=Ditylenchus dipsaci TaxID=166011 RepID=A0A915EVD1_9BILA